MFIQTSLFQTAVVTVLQYMNLSGASRSSYSTVVALCTALSHEDSQSPSDFFRARTYKCGNCIATSFSFSGQQIAHTPAEEFSNFGLKKLHSAISWLLTDNRFPYIIQWYAQRLFMKSHCKFLSNMHILNNF